MVESSREPVVIVGAGFSGAMLAARLAEQGLASVLIGRTADFGLGVAYSTPFEGHLLNVRSNRMSAVEGRPLDFVDWLSTRHPDLADPEDFAPRALYGRYVQDRLASVEAAHPGLIERIVGEVAAIEPDGVALSDGRRFTGRAVVLATGNPAPKTALPGDSDRIIPDPWAPGALDRIGTDDDVLIVGTGLTMVDMIQALTARGWRGMALALSRRGLLPRAHRLAPDVPAPMPPDALTGPASHRLAAARRLAARYDWREVMDAYRPITADLWRDASPDQRARLVRHLRPWWDVHRHRIAARIGEALDRLREQGRLIVHAGRLRRIESDDTGVVAEWSPRWGAVRPALRAAWMLDCTGPGHDAARDPLTGPLIAAGRARLDALRLGLELDAEGRVLHADGTSDPALFVLGPPARAAFWETIAVPDIRRRVEDVARTLAA